VEAHGPVNQRRTLAKSPMYTSLGRLV